MLDPNGIYLAYVRKSREDRDAEMNGAEDTLARHEYILNDLAKRYGITIAKWYKEVVSGETISDRPQMIALLNDIEKVHPTGVLVVEVERLSRGNPQDQGRVMDAFKYARTLIVTPFKIYDLNKENDEEWIDFGLLRSRMEYRTIKRRLQNGRTTSAMQGKYIGNIPPYGWLREKLNGEKGYTLVPDPETSWVLSLIADLLLIGTAETNYTPVGISTACRILDERGIKPPKGSAWDPASLSRIARNPVNAGIVRIGWRKQETRMVNGKKITSRPIHEDCISVPARWKGVYSQETLQAICSKLMQHRTVGAFHGLANPLAGILYCSVCGRTLRRRPVAQNPEKTTLLCPTRNCKTIGSYFDLVENRLVETLDQYLTGWKLHIDHENGIDLENLLHRQEQQLDALLKERENLKAQSDKIHSLFELEIYDLDTFLSRSQTLSEKLSANEKELQTAERELRQIRQNLANKETFVPRFESILTAYKQSDDPEFKNALMHELVSRVDYTKNVKASRNGSGADSFELDIHLNLQECTPK